MVSYGPLHSCAMCVRRSYENDRSVEEKGSLIIFLAKVFAYTQSHTTHTWRWNHSDRKKILHGKREKRYDANAHGNENIEPKKTGKVEKRARESFFHNAKKHASCWH